MSIQVFISYKSEYRDFAREVKSRVLSWGYKSWLDVDDIPEGSYFRFEIDKGLKTSDVVVGVITEEAQQSREVMAELDFALKKNKPLLPLKYQDCELLYHLESIQWIDFTKDREQGFDRLHKRLTQLAASLTQPETVSPVDSKTIDLLADFIDDNNKERSGLPLPPALKGQIIAVLDILSERDRSVLEVRFGLVDGQAHSRYETHKILGVANERIRQLEAIALRKILQYQNSQQESIQPQPKPTPPAEPARDSASLPGGAPVAEEIADLLPVRESESVISRPAATASQPMPAMQPQSPPSGYALPPMQAAPRRETGFFTFLRDLFRSTPRDDAELARTNRQRMLQKVRDFWVIGVLENALKESGAFDLGLSAAPGAVLRHVDYGDYALPTSANIGDIFDDLNRELLILGAPGAGKTILLLQLARDLILRAYADATLAIPVVFNLSSWAAERKPLADWLADELRLKYQVPKKVAQKWVETEQLTLLLDGLDEVAEPYRNACVEAINTYRRQYTKTDLAVCSRVADYDILTSRLDLRGAITLQPLSPEQINSYIDRPELSALRDALATDSIMQEMASTPFLLNTMAYAYRDASPSSLQISTSNDPAKARRKHLFDAYVEKRLKSSTSQYTAVQTRHYLSWLAHKMVEFKQSVFYIEGLQPGWLGTPNQRKLYVAITLFPRYLAGNSPEIKVIEGLKWSFNRKRLAGVAAGIVMVGLLFAAASGVLAGFFLGAVQGAVFGVLSGIGAALAFGVLLSLIFGLIPDEKIGIRIAPNQGIYRSLRTSFRSLLTFILFTTIAGGFVSGIAYGLIFSVVFHATGDLVTIAVVGTVTGLVVGVVVGMIVGLRNGSAAVSQHVSLRLIFWRSGSAPLNYARFLDYCASIQILRKVGGGYIFVHRYLLEYFAELNA